MASNLYRCTAQRTHYLYAARGAGSNDISNLKLLFVSTYSSKALNHYDVLEVTPKATAAQIKASYYRLSKQYHPDVNKTSTAKVKFTAISEAYEVLGNNAKRQQYDRGFGKSTSFPTGAGGSNIDVEYQEFMRKHGHFRKRGDAPKGRTDTYDFDEFYRMHYGDAIKQKQEKEAAKIKYNADMVDLKQNRIKRILVFSSIVFFMVGAIAIR